VNIGYFSANLNVVAPDHFPHLIQQPRFGIWSNCRAGKLCSLCLFHIEPFFAPKYLIDNLKSKFILLQCGFSRRLFGSLNIVRPVDHVMPKSPSRTTAELQHAIAYASRSSGVGESTRQKSNAQVGRVMYIECKAGSLTGTSRIGRVTFSKSGRTLYYDGQTFQSLKGAGFKSNYYCVETGEDYWISGPKRRGGDRMYGSALPVEIDEDVREEYWRDIRRQPERIHEPVA